MLSFLPRQITTRAIIVYLLALVTISLAFSSHAMKFGFIVLGCFWVIGFFLAVQYCTTQWRRRPETQFAWNLFGIALVLRLLWVVFSYYYYTEVTGTPFEYQAVDSLGYHLDAEWLAGSPWSATWNYLFGGYKEYSDSGYYLFLSVIYRIFGSGIIIPRIFNALLSSWACVLVYRMSSRTFGEETGRMAGIMMAFMPNLIIYCGYHLKETVMLFLEVASLERIDYLIRSPRFSFRDIILPILLAASLFLFRTVLFAAVIFAFVSTILISSAPAMKKAGKRIALVGWGVLALAVFSGGTIATEIEGYWEMKEENVQNKRLQQTLRGNQWAKYATGTVMAPMAFALPFATMVDVDQQYGQQGKSGGNYIRNFMSFFALLAIYEAVRRKKWRDFVLIGSFVIAYIGVVSLSGFSSSERFLLPGLPGLIMMWAYGVSALSEKSYRLLTPWCFIVFLMEFGWAFFKLGSRGIF